ncbi:MAG: cryptochrome/photolyase family protein, partial [Candidatus Promineifilaceae bacterium]
MKVVLWWLRRDLRLHDNQALAAALACADQVVPCFVLDPSILTAPTFSSRRYAFMLAGLRALDDDLKQRGSYLVVRKGNPQTVLARLMAETGADEIVAERDYSPYAVRRDAGVSAEMPLTLTQGLTVRQPEAVEKKAGGTYTVFTPFKKTWLKLPLPRRQQLIPAPQHIPTPSGVPTDPLLVSAESIKNFPSGEAEAQRRLQLFTSHRIYQYNSKRDLMAAKGTASLSPYLRFGMLSARQAVVAAIDAISRASDDKVRKEAEIWLSELVWREFYQQILFHFPHVRKGSFRPIYDQIKWRNISAEFNAWTQGKTGYPVVDAAMRQLWQTGYMHNRCRMIVG